MTAAQEWEEALARTEVAAAVAEDAAADAKDAAEDGDYDYAAEDAETALGALEDAVAAAEEALGEPVVADATAPRPQSDAESEELAALYADLTGAIHRAVCAVDDGTGSVESVRSAVAVARRVTA